jgi:hypothetical protein
MEGESKGPIMNLTLVMGESLAEDYMETRGWYYSSAKGGCP